MSKTDLLISVVIGQEQHSRRSGPSKSINVRLAFPSFPALGAGCQLHGISFAFRFFHYGNRHQVVTLL